MPLLSILDRYLLKKFISVLLFSLFGMVTIFVAVNYVENAEKFLDRKVPGDILIEYYLNFVPNIITLTLPVDILLASLFSIGGLARFNEITAIKASGVSMYRMLLPVITAAACVSTLDFWVSENIVPGANSKKSDLWKVYVDRVSVARRFTGNDITLYDPSGMKVVINKFDKTKLLATSISIQKFFGFNLVYRIDANEAAWDSSRNLWVFRSGVTRSFDNGQESFKKFIELEKSDLFFTPEIILKREKNPDEMNYAELKDFVSKLRTSGARAERWEVDYYLKFSYPLTCFFMALFGAPLAASRKRSGAGLNVFLTLVICFAYWIAIQSGRYMGYNQTLDPLIAAWIGNFIFGTLSVFIFLRLKS